MPVGLIEILLIFMVFLVLGPRRILNLLRSLGTGVHDFIETLGKDKNSPRRTKRSEAYQRAACGSLSASQQEPSNGGEKIHSGAVAKGERFAPGCRRRTDTKKLKC